MQIWTSPLDFGYQLGLSDVTGTRLTSSKISVPDSRWLLTFREVFCAQANVVAPERGESTVEFFTTHILILRRNSRRFVRVERIDVNGCEFCLIRMRMSPKIAVQVKHIIQIMAVAASITECSRTECVPEGRWHRKYRAAIPNLPPSLHTYTHPIGL